jgi:hypothetical protein
MGRMRAHLGGWRCSNGGAVESSRMSRSLDLTFEAGRGAWRWLAMSLAVLALVPVAGAQVAKKRARRESNSARKARIERTIEQTYGYKYEVFGGGGYMRFKSGDFTKKNNEVTWQASASYALSPKVAVVADARGMFGDAHALINNIYGVYRPSINEYTFMGGGSYRFYRKEKVAVSAQALGGVAWGLFNGGSRTIPDTALGLWPTGWKPVFSVGVSADYNFYPNLAFRVTPNLVETTFGGGLQSNPGVNMGVVYRFGKR